MNENKMDQPDYANE